MIARQNTLTKLPNGGAKRVLFTLDFIYTYYLNFTQVRVKLFSHRLNPSLV